MVAAVTGAAILLLGACRQTPVQFDRMVARSVESVVEHSDGSVTFSLYAPSADTVRLTGDLASAFTDLVKDSRGVWSVTVPDVEPGSYRYGFNVDGLNVVDPVYPRSKDILAMAELKFGSDPFWEVKDVPHGAMSKVFYHSSTMGEIRRMHVWTPAGYFKSSENLPVLYLLHGGGDIDSGWPVIGCAGEILDNLLAEGKMTPMVVVMPDASIPAEKFVPELVKDIKPYVEENFRVKTGTGNTALAGLSMGGIQILETLLQYPTLFRYVHIMSSGFFLRDEADVAAYEQKLSAVADDIRSTVSLLVFTQGGPEDIAYRNGEKTRALFTRCEIPFEYSEMPGGHNWYVWRFDLANFAQRIFR